MFVSTSTPTLDPGPLQVFAGLEDEAGGLLPQIVRIFITETDKSLADARDAVSGANLSSLRRIAQNLIGSCGTIGATRMQALASELEAVLVLGQFQSAGSSVRMLVEEFGLVRAILGQYIIGRTQ